MTNMIIQAQLSEICVKCGMCCDGTLFSRATIKDEADEKLAQSFGLETFTSSVGKRSFKLPCHHFERCCTVYDKTRPSVCCTYFCKPLREVQQGSSDVIEARKIIEKALLYRSEVLMLASQSETYKAFNIRQLIEEILPKPTEQIKQNRELWLKVVGFQGMVSKITGTKKHTN